MLTVPIFDQPSQSLQVTLGQQLCTINIYQKNTGLFCDLLVNDALIIGGVLCENLNRIVRSVYLGFVGDLVFDDTQGSDDPSYPGLGDRYVLIYVEAADL